MTRFSPIGTPMQFREIAGRYCAVFTGERGVYVYAADAATGEVDHAVPLAVAAPGSSVDEALALLT